MCCGTAWRVMLGHGAYIYVRICKATTLTFCCGGAVSSTPAERVAAAGQPAGGGHLQLWRPLHGPPGAASWLTALERIASSSSHMLLGLCCGLVEQRTAQASCTRISTGFSVTKVKGWRVVLEWV